MGARKLKVLIAHHRWWYPTSVSGADIANHEFARRLRASGLDVRVYGISPPEAEIRVRQRDYVADGLPVCLVTTDFIRRLTETVRDFSPDVVLTSCPGPSCGADDITRMVETLCRHGLPIALYVHDIGGTLPLFEAVKDRLAAVITNSSFMAARIDEQWAIEADVVYPVPDRAAVDAGGRGGPFITFFNPLPHKGLSVAHNLVTRRFPDRPFLFVEGFIDPESHGIALSRSGNLVHARRSPTVAAIYRMTRTLVVPSQWEEPFGRVALEAMYNRVPVVASRTGGLLESVGDGGVLIDDFGNVERWVEEIERLDDPAHRREIVAAGTAHAAKFSAEEETKKLIAVLRRAARTKKRPRRRPSATPVEATR
jgi:glycosyltransferase involved in cell wall biosynthesis